MTTPRSRKRKFVERDAKGRAVKISERKKRKISITKTKSNRSSKSKSKTRTKSKSKKKAPLRKSKRLANKNKNKNKRSASPLSKKRRGMSTKAKHKDKSIDYNAYLFDNTCLYSMLEVFLIGYDNDNDKESEEEKESIRDDLWEWLWIWEQRASAYYRILITPVYEHNCFEVRVDSIHGIECGLLSELLLNGITFEYFYAYSRKQIWGGWKFCHNQRVIHHDIYGNVVHDTEYCRIWQPPKIWKQMIWFKQLKMELMYKKYGAHNMNRLNLSHYFYGQQMAEIDNGNSKGEAKKKKKMQQNASSFDVESYQMAQIFDNAWCKMHEINATSIRLNVDDLSMILGTKLKMRCAQCHQTHHLCRAVKLCECFCGYFVENDLYQRHQSMVEDWKEIITENQKC